MSDFVKDLYDYDLVKKCSKCKIVKLKSNFHKDKNREDGLQPYCICCRTQYYNENRDKTRNYYLENRDKIRNYYLENRDKIIAQKRIYCNNKYKSDINFRLIKKTRNRIYKSLKGVIKQSSTKDILGIDIETYKKWIEFQFTPEMNWDNIEIDHVKAICMFDVSDDEPLKKAFSWKNTQPLLKQHNRQKGKKFNDLDYQLQFIKAYQFLKLNEERLN